MPIYEYECQKCGEKFEVFRSIADTEDKVKCPKCGSKNSQRTFSTFATGSASGGTTHTHANHT